MPKTHTITTYSYSELSDKAKARAREQAAEVAREMFDADATLDDFHEIARLLGLSLTEGEPSYSGFCSQGDGASFAGAWSPGDTPGPDLLAAVRAHAPGDTALHAIAGTLQTFAEKYPGIVVTLTRSRVSGRYVHEHTINMDVDAYDTEDNSIEIPVTDSDAITEALRDLMRWLYAQIEAEWEYVQSDAACVESIEANEIEFTEDGRVY